MNKLGDEKLFSFDGREFRGSFERSGWCWEVWWPPRSWIALDGSTEEDIKSSWEKQKQEIINDGSL